MCKRGREEEEKRKRGGKEKRREERRGRKREKREGRESVGVYAVGSPVTEKGGELDRPTPAKKMPILKVEASFSNIRVAIVEDVEDPQALTLRVSLLSFLHLLMLSPFLFSNFPLFFRSPSPLTFLSPVPMYSIFEPFRIDSWVFRLGEVQK